jgi:hypothetical protein
MNNNQTNNLFLTDAPELKTEDLPTTTDQHPLLGKDDIENIAKIASETEPEYKTDGYGKHNWCADTAVAVERYLARRQIATRPLYPQGRNVTSWGCYHSFIDSNWSHTWVELKDGTIIDPTVAQFFRYEACRDKNLMSPLNYLDYPDNNQFWIVSKNDSRRKHYLYINQDDMTLIGTAADRETGF